MAIVDRTGIKYGRLTAISSVGRNKDGCIIWHCRCECGQEKDVVGASLHKGNTRSCGCLVRDTNRKYNLNEDIFSAIDSSPKAYWLGFILADGCIPQTRNCLQIRLQERDGEHLQKLKSFLESDAPIRKRGSFIRATGKTYQGYIFVVHSSLMCHNLIDIGILPNKSLRTMSIHRKIPNEFARDYWRGIIDGDGSLRYGSSKTSKTPVLNLVGDINITESFRDFCGKIVEFSPKITPHSSIFSISYSGEKAVRMVCYLYRNADIYLDRKYRLANEFMALPQYSKSAE